MFRPIVTVPVSVDGSTGRMPLVGLATRVRSLRRGSHLDESSANHSNGTGAAGYGSVLIWSLTAPRISCLRPRYVQWSARKRARLENWMCSSSPPDRWHRPAHEHLRSCGATWSSPIFLAYCFTSMLHDSFRYAVTPLFTCSTDTPKESSGRNPGSSGPAVVGRFDHLGTGTIRM